MVDHMPDMTKALGLIPSPEKGEEKEEMEEERRRGRRRRRGHQAAAEAAFPSLGPFFFGYGEFYPILRT